MTTPHELRPLPEPVVRSFCSGCHAPLVWALTVAGPNGPGGKLMPLDPVEDLAGNVAVTAPRRGRLLARVLQRDELVDRPLEYAAMPHFASCPAKCHPDLPDVPAPEPVRGRGRRRR